MGKKRDLIETTVRSCISRLGGAVTEQQIQGLIASLLEMKDIKEVVDTLALRVDKKNNMKIVWKIYYNLQGIVIKVKKT